MKKIVCDFFLLLFFVSTSSAQAKQVDEKNNALAVGLYRPVGSFGDSHVIGIGVDYWRISFRQHKYSRNTKQIAFVLNGGVHYFIGKNITVSDYEFEFRNFFSTHIMTGLLYHPFKRSIIQLSAGPTANLYKKNIRVGGGANLFAGYYWTKKISAGPVINFRKFSNTTALWSAGLTASYYF